MTVLTAANKLEALELSAIAEHLQIFGIKAEFDGFKGQLITEASERSVNTAKMFLNGIPVLETLYEVC